MRYLIQLRHDRRGAAAIEFAFAAPVFLAFLIGIIQLGTLGQAANSLSYGIDEAARLAAIYPKPSDAAIKARLQERTFAIDPRKLTLSVAYGKANNVNYADLTATYPVKINFVFTSDYEIVLTQRRRVFQPDT